MSKPNRVCAKCPTAIYSDNKSGLCVRCRYNRSEVTTPVDPAEMLAADRQHRADQHAFVELKKKYEAALAQIDRQSFALAYLDQIREGVPSTYTIEAQQKGESTNEATPIVIASDWHSEEIVTPAQVSGLNAHNLDINERRVTRFWQSSMNLIKNHLNPGVRINTVVLGLLGDFITGQIHEAENAENNALTPIPALMRVQAMIVEGINFWLNHTTYNYVVVCKVGNHSRVTRRVRSASEAGHSLETLMYAYLAAQFQNEPRVKFVIDDGYHTYVNVYNKVLRFHHGHSILYQGGIGGLFIPAFKAVSQWDKAIRADYDIFGHFHQTKDGGKFLCNGSGIGYNAFALRIKADYEPPQQTLFLIDKKHGRTSTWPIFLEKQ